MRRNFFLFFCFFVFFFYLLIFPRSALVGAQNGLLLWYRSVVPILFPFLLLSNLAMRTNLLYPLTALFYRPLHLLFGCSQAGCFAILSGFLCGFPVGAKITADLASNGIISTQEASFLLCFCNNVSPAFLLSYLALGQLNAPALGPAFLTTVLGASLLYGVLSSFPFRSHLKTEKETAPSPPPVFSFAMLDPCLMDAIQNTVRLGGYLVLFSILDGCITLFLPSGHLSGLLAHGLMEVTNGLHLIATSKLSLPVKFIFLSACASFGGFSALAQTIAVSKADRKNTFRYIKSRVMITLLSIFLAMLVLCSPLL